MQLRNDELPVSKRKGKSGRKRKYPLLETMGVGQNFLVYIGSRTLVSARNSIFCAKNKFARDIKIKTRLVNYEGKAYDGHGDRYLGVWRVG